MMLQLDKPEDFVVASGESHSVREFVEASFSYVGRDIEWEGQGLNEVGKEKSTGIVRVKVDPKYFRPTEVVSIQPTILQQDFSLSRSDARPDVMPHYLQSAALDRKIASGDASARDSSASLR